VEGRAGSGLRCWCATQEACQAEVNFHFATWKRSFPHGFPHAKSGQPFFCHNISHAISKKGQKNEKEELERHPFWVYVSFQQQ